METIWTLVGAATPARKILNLDNPHRSSAPHASRHLGRLHWVLHVSPTSIFMVFQFGNVFVKRLDRPADLDRHEGCLEATARPALGRWPPECRTRLPPCIARAAAAPQRRRAASRV